MEGQCSKYKKELYGSMENENERIVFPKESKAEFVYDVETNLCHHRLFDSNQNNRNNMSTETKNQFTRPEKCGEVQGARRKAFEENLLRQVSREVLEDELRRTKKPNDLTTEYRSNFTSVNFVPNDFFSRQMTERSLRYPVYGTGNNAITIYSYGYKNKNNLLSPFRRFGTITKSPFERFDVDTS